MILIVLPGLLMVLAWLTYPWSLSVQGSLVFSVMIVVFTVAVILVLTPVGSMVRSSLFSSSGNQPHLLSSRMRPTAYPGKGILEFIQMESGKAYDAWSQVVAIESDGWQGDFVRAILRLHAATESGLKAMYAAKRGVAPLMDFKFLETVEELFPSIDMNSMKWFNTIRNKVAHGAYEPQVQECSKAFKICNPIICEAIRFRPKMSIHEVFSSESTKTVCSKCGLVMGKDATFCPRYGQRLE